MAKNKKPPEGNGGGTMLPPEWSHRLQAETIGMTPTSVKITASAQECKDLSRRMKVTSINGLKAEFKVVRESGNIIHVTGQVSATVIQPCALTAEPVEDKIAEDIEAWFADQDRIISITKARNERSIKEIDAEVQIMDEKDDPEPIIDGHIDLGEIAAQHLSLCINPYPRSPGAEEVSAKVLKTLQVTEEAASARRNPFAALKDWKKARQ